MLDCRATADLLAAGEITVIELTECYLAAIERFNSQLNCYLHVDPDGALAAAAAADQRRRNGQVRGPLDGIPVAVKDNIAVEGWPNTAGLAWRADLVAAADAAVIAQLRAAGAVLLGSANMDEGALSASSNNPHFGACHNPLRPGFTAGGSSGGSACAVRAGLASLALGSDTMGSVRIPAAYCGVVGFKPSFGAIPMSGVVPVWEKLDHLGFLVRRVGDLQALLDTVATVSPGRSDSRPTVGVVRLSGAVTVEPAVMSAFEQALLRLEAAGYPLIEVDTAGYDPGLARRAGFLLAERALAEWMGERRHEPGAVSPSFKGMVEFGARQDDAKVARARRRLDEAASQATSWLEHCDVLATPTTPQRAFSLESPVPDSQADFTAFANFTGWPAISVPAAHSADSLPVGVQLLAPSGQDLSLIQVAATLEPEEALELAAAFTLG